MYIILYYYSHSSVTTCRLSSFSEQIVTMNFTLIYTTCKTPTFHDNKRPVKTSIVLKNLKNVMMNLKLIFRRDLQLHQSTVSAENELYCKAEALQHQSLNYMYSKTLLAQTRITQTLSLCRQIFLARSEVLGFIQRLL